MRRTSRADDRAAEHLEDTGGFEDTRRATERQDADSLRPAVHGSRPGAEQNDRARRRRRVVLRETVEAVTQRRADRPWDDVDACGEVADQETGQPPPRRARLGRDPQPDDAADEADEQTVDRDQHTEEVGHRGGEAAAAERDPNPDAATRVERPMCSTDCTGIILSAGSLNDRTAVSDWSA